MAPTPPIPHAASHLLRRPRRDAGSVEVRGAVAPQVGDQPLAARHVAARRPKGLGEGAHQHVHVPGVHARVLAEAPAVGGWWGGGRSGRGVQGCACWQGGGGGDEMRLPAVPLCQAELKPQRNPNQATAAATHRPLAPMAPMLWASSRYR